MRGWVLGMVSILAAVGAVGVLAEEPGLDTAPTAAAMRGKQIYLTGTSPRGRPLSAMLLGNIELPAEQHPCVQCHGVEGRGGEQGGVWVPDIRWARLTAPYGVPGPRGNLRPAYDRGAVRRAVSAGIHSGGGTLDEVMPRYLLGDEDLEDLLAYLRVLGTERAPGTGADRIRVGTLLPLSGPGGRSGQAVAFLLRRYFERLNAARGIDGRRIDLVVRDVGPGGESPGRVARELASGPDAVLCFVANAGPGASLDVLRVLHELDVPLVGPLAFAREARGPDTVFYLLSSLGDEGRAAARYLAERSGPEARPVALVWSATLRAREMAQGFAQESDALGRPPVLATEWSGEDPPGLVERLRASGAGVLVFLGSAQAARPLIAGAAPKWRPTLVASAALLGGSVPAPGDTLLLVSPGVAPGAAGDLRRFTRLLEPSPDEGPKEHSVLRDPASRSMQMTAFAAAELLTLTLKKSGAPLSRIAVLEQLRAVRGFPTGVMPPLRFGPNRRVAARGALIVAYDATGRRTSARWVEVDPS